jgi:hypothetical protein
MWVARPVERPSLDDLSSVPTIAAARARASSKSSRRLGVSFRVAVLMALLHVASAGFADAVLQIVVPNLGAS